MLVGMVIEEKLKKNTEKPFGDAEGEGLRGGCGRKRNFTEAKLQSRI